MSLTADVDLARTIEALAQADHLLVASDFDGTIAEIVPVPADARPDPASVQALRDLSALPRTTSAIVSGRSLDVLRTLTGLADSARLVGSHGLEFDTADTSLDADVSARLAAINRAATDVADRYRGIELEHKPAGTAIHYRHVDPAHQVSAVAAITNGPSSVPGAHVTDGKMVVEIAAAHADKGDALDRLRNETSASAIVFIGDDVTDENAFARLRATDVGVKVGPGKTAASVRIDDTAAVARFLTRLAAARRIQLGI